MIKWKYKFRRSVGKVINIRGRSTMTIIKAYVTIDAYPPFQK